MHQSNLPKNRICSHLIAIFSRLFLHLSIATLPLNTKTEHVTVENSCGQHSQCLFTLKEFVQQAMKMHFSKINLVYQEQDSAKKCQKLVSSMLMILSPTCASSAEFLPFDIFMLKLSLKIRSRYCCKFIMQRLSISPVVKQPK